MAKSVRKPKSKTPNPKGPVTNKDLAKLREAIEDAAGWKGNLMPEDFPQFDANIARMKLALARVKHQRALLTSLRNITNTPISNDGIVERFRHVMENYK